MPNRTNGVLGSTLPGMVKGNISRNYTSPLNRVGCVDPERT